LDILFITRLRSAFYQPQLPKGGCCFETSEPSSGTCRSLSSGVRTNPHLFQLASPVMEKGLVAGRRRVHHLFKGDNTAVHALCMVAT